VNVLITGAAGFLGRHFSRAHIERGDAVDAVDDMSSPYASWPFHVELIEADAQYFIERRLSQDLPPYDLVYWFAAPVGGREKIDGDPLFNADSLRLDSALFRWAAMAKPGIIVYPSSSAIYGTAYQRRWGNMPLREEMFTPADRAWDTPDQMYGMTKLVGEYLAWKASDYGVHTLCIRPFSGYGEDQSLEYPMPSIVARARKREDPLEVWGDGTQRRDWIHVDDIVGATHAALARGVGGYRAMNIGSGVGTSFDDVALMAASIAGYEPSIRHLPTKPTGVHTRVSDNYRMLDVYEPKVSLAEGIARMLA
jgi:nucleoside-diphosphate-sugar epimerase